MLCALATVGFLTFNESWRVREVLDHNAKFTLLFLHFITLHEDHLLMNRTGYLYTPVYNALVKRIFFGDISSIEFRFKHR